MEIVCNDTKFIKNRIFVIADLYLEKITIRNIEFVLDTGAENSIIRTKHLKYSGAVKPFESFTNDKDIIAIAQKIRNGKKLTKDELKIVCNCNGGISVGFNGALSVNDRIQVPAMIVLGHNIQGIELYVSENTHRNIIGMDLLKYFNISINSVSETLTVELNPEWKSLVKKNPNIGIIHVATEESVKHF